MNVHSLSIIALKTQKQARCSPSAERTNKLWYSHIIGYSAKIREKQITDAHKDSRMPLH